jgi:hypothetical protein
MAARAEIGCKVPYRQSPVSLAHLIGTGENVAGISTPSALEVFRLITRDLVGTT